MKIKYNLDHSELEKIGYIYSVIEGGYISEDGATIITINRSPYQGQVSQYRADDEVRHMENVEKLKEVGALSDEISITVKDSKGKTFRKDWKNTDDKRNAIRWTLESTDLPFYVGIAEIVEISVKPS